MTTGNDTYRLQYYIVYWSVFSHDDTEWSFDSLSNFRHLSKFWNESQLCVSALAD